MKHLWKILFLIPIIAIFQITYSGPLWVEKIDVTDQNTLSVTLSQNPNLKQGNNEGEITILRDMKIASTALKAGSANQVEVFLDKEILPSTSYSLLTVAGSEGSIDFTTPVSVEGYSQVNVESFAEQDISSIEILDAKTLIVSYKKSLSASSFDYKFLSESKVVSIEKKSFENPQITLTTSTPLVWEQDYILMMVDLKDVDGVPLEFDTGIYDFKTPVFPEIQTLVEDETNMPELNAATLETSLQKTTTQDTASAATLSGASLETVAATAQQTPATGPATWILLLLTLTANVFYFMSRRKRLS